MSPTSWPFKRSRPATDQLLPRLRIPIIVGALVLIVFYTIYLSIFVPNFDFFGRWQPDNVFEVVAVSSDRPAAGYLQPGDVILTVDGEPAIQTIWRPLFRPLRSSYHYTIQRGEEQLAFDIPVAPATLEFIRRRVTTGTVALATWFVAALVLLFATPQNRDAWRLGLVTMGIAVMLAASEAALYDVPTAWLASNPIIPVLSVAWAEIALIPRNKRPSNHGRPIFHWLYGVAILIGLLALFELLYLNPRGSSFEILTGLSLYDLLLASIGGGGLAHLVILSVRLLRMPKSYQRQQVLIVLAFTALAVLPAVLLSILPRVIFGNPLLPFELSIALLALVPAGYGYVIYRRNYLGLDPFVTQSVALLLVSLLLLAVYAVIFYFLRRSPTLNALEPLPSMLFLFPMLMLIPYAGKVLGRPVQILVYGTPAPYQESLVRFTSALSANPQTPTLKSILYEVADLLQVRQAALLLADKQGQLVCLENLRVEVTSPIFTKHVAAHFTEPTLHSQFEMDGLPFTLTLDPWIELLAPLSIGGKLVGLLLLGCPIPDGHFNAQQVAFVRQVASVMAVAVETIRLFEASREMSRELLRVRDEERTQLAARIHDGPLQGIALVAGGLDTLIHTPALLLAEADNSLATHNQNLRDTARQLREICAGLRPPFLQQGIQWAIRDVVYAFRDNTGLDTRLTVRVSDLLLIPENTSVAIYHVLTEALNNIHKHAEATIVSVALVHQNGYLHLSVEDDGHGTSLASLSLSDLVREHHFGIVGMHEWASLAQGKLTISQGSPGGTLVILEVPFAATADEQ